MSRNKETPAPEAESWQSLRPSLDRFEGRHYGGLAASLALHFIVLMGMWWTTQTPRPPKPYLVEVEILEAEPIKTTSKVTPSKSTKLASKESKLRHKPPKPAQQKTAQKTPPEPVPEIQEYEMDATVVKAGKRGAKARKQAGKLALPDVSQPVALTSRAELNQSRLNQSPEQTAAASLQQSERRGTLKPRLSSVGQQASSRLQLPSQAGVESENGPKLIASNAPAAQTLAPEFRHSSRPGGTYSSQGGAAQPAMGGGSASEAAQAHSLQSSSYAGSAAGNPLAPRVANAVAGVAPGAVFGKAAGRSAGQFSGPAALADARTGAVAPAENRGAVAPAENRGAASSTEIRSSGGQGEQAATGAPINPMQINSAGGTGNKAAASGASLGGGAGLGTARTTGGDAAQPGSGASGGRGMDEGGGAGSLLAAAGQGRSIGAAARGMSAAIVPEGGTAMRAGLTDESGAAPMQRVQARGTAYATEERYATQAMKVHSPKSVCELPLMMAGFDRRPLPEGLASIMGSESAMIMEAPPVLLPGNIQPTYPLAALAGRQQGRAVVRAQVLASGQVGEVFIKQTSGAALLDQAAMTTVRNWRFKPAKRNGEAVPAWVNVPIEYRNPS